MKPVRNWISSVIFADRYLELVVPMWEGMPWMLYWVQRLLALMLSTRMLRKSRAVFMLRVKEVPVSADTMWGVSSVIVPPAEHHTMRK